MVALQIFQSSCLTFGEDPTTTIYYIYHREDTKVGSQTLATKFGFVPDSPMQGLIDTPHETIVFLFVVILYPGTLEIIHPKASYHYAVRCLNTKSHEVLKLQDLILK